MSSIEPTDPIAVRDNRPWGLVITHRVWSESCRALVADREAWATGDMIWNPGPLVRELLCRSLTVVSHAPRGRDRLPLADWTVLRILPPDERLNEETLARLIAQIGPSPNQTLVLVVLDGADPARWDGAVAWQGRCEPLEEIRIVGPEMIRLTRQAEPAEDEHESGDSIAERRASRTRGAVGPVVYRRLRRSTVTLVGAGRIGSSLAFQLAGLGVERLRLLDPDFLGIENLDAMPGLTARDVGRRKVDAIARRLHQFRPDFVVTRLACSFSDPRTSAFLRQRADLIITAVDDDAPRLGAAIVARRNMVPHLDVATSIQGRADDAREITAEARLFLPGSGEGCVVCVGGMQNIDDLLYDLDAPPGSLRRRLRPAWNQQRAGSLVTVNSIVVGAALQTWLDLLSGRLRNSFWQRLAWRPGQGLVGDAGVVRGAPDCRFCGQQQ